MQAETLPGQGEPTNPGSLICILPNQGILQPFEKIPVFFRFSPRSVNIDLLHLWSSLFVHDSVFIFVSLAYVISAIN